MFTEDTSENDTSARMMRARFSDQDAKPSTLKSPGTLAKRRSEAQRAKRNLLRRSIAIFIVVPSNFKSQLSFRNNAIGSMRGGFLQRKFVARFPHPRWSSNVLRLIVVFSRQQIFNNPIGFAILTSPLSTSLKDLNELEASTNEAPSVLISIIFNLPPSICFFINVV